MNAWSREGQHPADIGWCDKVPGRSQQMRAQDGALREGLFNIVVSCTWQAQFKRPFRACVILGLDSAQPPHHLTWLLKCSQGNVLVKKSLAHNI